MPELEKFAIQALLRLVNTGRTAEGSLLPPRQAGTSRIPLARNVRVIKRKDYLGGTEFTVGWQEPEENADISHYNVYVRAAVRGTVQQQGPFSTRRSPAIFRVTFDRGSPVIFYVQTVMKNGQVSEIEYSSTCVDYCAEGKIDTADYGVNSFPVEAFQKESPGKLLTWDTSGNPTTVGPGASGTLLAGTGNSPPQFRTFLQLDLVRGAGNLSHTGRLVKVSGSGFVTEASLNDSEVVPSSRRINTGTGLAGGGDLSENRELSVVEDTTVQRVAVRANSGTEAGARRCLNFIQGTNVQVEASDDDTDNEIEVTISVPYLPQNARVETRSSSFTASDKNVYLCNAQSGAITVSLPVASSSTGRIYTFKKVDSSANAVTIDPNGSETVDGALTYVLSSQWKYVTIVCNGTAWFVIASN